MADPEATQRRSRGRREARATELELLSQKSRWKGDDDLVFAHPETGKPVDRSKPFTT